MRIMAERKPRDVINEKGGRVRVCVELKGKKEEKECGDKGALYI
jgi:hypothetical protein